MAVLEWTLALLLGAVLLAAIARRLAVPSPALLALGGVALALLPDGPRISMEPDLALALFVAPVLLDAAFDSSLRDLRKNWFPVTSLVVIAVAVTTAAIALTARWFIPAMSWPVAITLGALVAPPDAAAATAVLKEVRLPHRLLVVLEGESLLNDASALLIYRLAIGAAFMHPHAKLAVASTLALVLGGSLVFGGLSALVYSPIVQSFSDVPSSIVMQFIGAFGIWIMADRLHLSGVLAIVAFAVVLSRRSIRMPAAVRVPSYAVWDTAVFLLNALAFVMIGLQVRPIFERISPGELAATISFALAVLAVVILSRAAWVMTYNRALWLINRVLGDRTPRLMDPPPLKRGIVAAWCGMRGIVTLAAALALPDGSGGGPAFPYRDIIVLTAFSVVVGTLFIQGFTLRPLVSLLRLEADETVEREVQAGRQEMLRAALESVGDGDNEIALSVRREYSEILGRVDGTRAISTEAREAEITMRSEAIASARAMLGRLRFTGAIGDDAFHQLEAELDLYDLDAAARSRW